MRKDSKNLSLPNGFTKHPVLVCDFNDRLVVPGRNSVGAFSVYSSSLLVIVMDAVTDLKNENV